MLKRDRAILINKGVGTQDEYGGYVEGNQTSKPIMCDIQPFSRALTLKKYGYDIAVTKLMFCSINEDIVEGSIIVFKGKNYIVMKIPYDRDHFEIVLNNIN